MPFPKQLSPIFWADKLFTLSLELTLAALLCVLSFVEGKEVRTIKKVTVNKKSINEKQDKKDEKLKRQQKDRAIQEADRESGPTVTHISSRTKTANIITGTLSELKPDSETLVSSQQQIETTVCEVKVTEKAFKDDNPSIGEIEEKKTSIGEIEEKKTSIKTNESNIIPIEFHWRHGGSRVFVTGDFDNWQVSHEMHLSPVTNDFVAVVEIDRTKQHAFKFVVDGVWLVNKDLPTHHDEHGNINNIIYAFPSDPLCPEFKEHITAPFSAQLTASAY